MPMHAASEQPEHCKTLDPRAIGAVPEVKDKWRLVGLFMKYKGICSQHLESYNHLVAHGLKEIVFAKSNKVITSDADPNWFIEYTNVYVDKPSIEEQMVVKTTTPQQCRVRDLTYSAPIFVDVNYYVGEKDGVKNVVTKRGIEIGRMPVMLRSDICVLHNKTTEQVEHMFECPYDPGGYFIIRGVEKLLMMQEQLSNNRIIVEKDGKQGIVAIVTSSTVENKSRTMVCGKPDGTNKMKSNLALYLKHNAFTELIPVFIIFKAMGVCHDQEIIQLIGNDKKFVSLLMACVEECHAAEVFSQKQALEYLSKKIKDRTSASRTGSYGGEQKKVKVESPKQKMDHVKDTLRRQVLSHVADPPGARMTNKIVFLAVMVRRILEGRQNEKLLDDRDYYGNKRVDLAGSLLALLFEDLFKNLNAELKKQADKMLAHTQTRDGPFTYPDVLHSGVSIGSARITKGLVHAISSGNWNIKRFKIDRSGVSQVLSRFSYMAAIGAMGRVKSQFEKSRKVAGPRALQPSQWGMLCPADTPEGEQCGLIKNLCLMTHVTTGLRESEEKPLTKVCFSLGVEDTEVLTGEELHSGDDGVFLVFLNGALIGVHRHPHKFLKNMRLLRRQGKIGEFISIYHHENTNSVVISSDAGRLCRPLIIVEKGKMKFDPAKHIPLLAGPTPKWTFKEFLTNGVVEWVDVNEENNLLIAINPEDIIMDTTHMEVEGFSLLGIISGLVAYPNHNQSPRNTYTCAMGKQAMGAIAYNQFHRTDNVLYLLNYPEKPLTKSKTLDLVNYGHLGAGQNASVAVMSFSGYDIEDAIVMNKQSMDRGFGRCMVIKRHVVTCENHPNSTQDVVMPPPKVQIGMRTMSHSQRKYALLDSDGLIRVGEVLEKDSVMVNKMTPENTSGDVKPSADGDVARIPNPLSFKETSVGGKWQVDRVILTQDGDGNNLYKIMARETRLPELGDKFASRHGQKGVVGLICPQVDFPFSEYGWCPDLIMNPHGFPSRMTVGKMFECVGSKAAALEGTFADGSCFGGTSPELMYRTLIKHGFAPTGKEYLTSGITGEPLECYVFVGPIYYQKLKHMVADKVHARARGRVNILTRQPTEGRAKGGGLRLGEMERDCLVAYGASNLLLERLMLSSDVADVAVCKQCGLFASKRKDGGLFCSYCCSYSHVIEARMPYACKLLFQEMQSMNVCCRLKFSSDG
eukprot:GEMP01003074.1.p1 GENE.GEMP01003074.1~~GEMP01003074.1.p1  ORF type:complete len:1220 (+),score=278.51 GEMP01003074.1:80-3661(+)